MILISGFEARGLADSIIAYLNSTGVEVDPDTRSDLTTLIRYHGGLNWDDTEGFWYHPDTGEKLTFNPDTLRCES